MAFDFPAIDPVAVSFGPLQIRWYALAYLGGFLAAWRYGVRLADRNKPARPDRNDIDDFIPWSIIGVIAGGRIGYILFYHLEYYMQQPMEIVQVWHGGMSFHGGVLGVTAALVIFSLRRGFSPRRLADIVCCGAPIGLFLGRIANFINGELFGRVTDMPWGVKFPASDYRPRHPSQLYEAALEGIVLFAVLYVLAQRKEIRDRPGMLTAAFLVLYGVFRIFVEFFREPDEYLGFILPGISMGQILSVPLIALGICVALYARSKKAMSS